MTELHLASVDTDNLTHLTSDAEKTLCDIEVTDLPNFATEYCSQCILGEYVLAPTVLPSFKPNLYL